MLNPKKNPDLFNEEKPKTSLFMKIIFAALVATATFNIAVHLYLAWHMWF